MIQTRSSENGFLHPFMGKRSGGRNVRRLLRGIGRGTRSVIRSARPRRQRRGCCCCPLVLVLGLAGVSSIAGLFYWGIRFLGWA